MAVGAGSGRSWGAAFAVMRYALGVMLVGLIAAGAASAAQNAPAAAGPPAGGFRLGTGLGGQMVFVQHCNTCHIDTGGAAPQGEGRAPTLTSLQQLPPERILDALVSGKMTAIGAQLRDD